MKKAIPEDIRDFILAHIDSIAQLECLLLFHANARLEGKAAVIARRLYIGDREAEELLRHLVKHGFLRQENDVYTYDPAAPEDAATVARLAEVYARCLIPVTRLVHAKRRNRIQEFANAFWIRKD